MFNTQKNIKYIGFNDRWLMLVGIPALAVLVIAIFCDFRFSSLSTPFGSNFIEGLIFTTFFWITLRAAIIFFRKRIPNFKDARKRITYQIIFILIFVPVAGAILAFTVHSIQDKFLLPTTYRPTPEVGTFATLLISIMMVAVYEAIYFYHQLKQSITERELTKQEHIRSQLEGLRNQVNPHFLFNSMNTLMNIVQEDQKLAIHFLEKLSKVYRYILESKDEELIPLQRELEFIHAYVFLQQERFRGNLKVDIDIPSHKLEYYILPLSLQILFENVIKHNIISSKLPLNVWVYIEGEKLVVKNSLQRKNQVLHSTKVGLQNIKTRYQYFTQSTVDVIEDDQFFSVKIPLLAQSDRL